MELIKHLKICLCLRIINVDPNVVRQHSLVTGGVCAPPNNKDNSLILEELIKNNIYML